MKRPLKLAVLALVMAACGSSEPSAELAAEPRRRVSPPAPMIPYKVVGEYPHDTAAFTQGLLLDSPVLYESTGLEGRSSVRIVDFHTGHPKHIFALPNEYFGEGLALLGDTLYQLTWKSRVGFQYERSTLRRIGTFSYETEGWGLTENGEHLIMSDGTETIYFRDPATFAIVRAIEVQHEGTPITQLNELEYVNGAIYANIWRDNRIARIDPATGDVTGWMDILPVVTRETRQDVPNGIAYDETSGRLLITGKFWRQIYALEGRF